jgi:hypothetical protein
MSLETFLENITIEELEELKKLKEQENACQKQVYSFSSMTDVKLNKCVDIEREFDILDKFSSWFGNNFDIPKDDVDFLEKLIDKYSLYINGYKEESLKAHFVIPILNRVDFLLPEYKCSGLYEEKLVYEAEEFIFSGTTDFIFSKGLIESKKPYFFIQEFKRNEENSSPRTQLLAELISAVELNNWTTIKGAYIVGSIWNFVILERLEKHKYQYYISQNFDSTKIDDLKDIYRNLVFVKNEIIEMIKNGE